MTAPQTKRMTIDEAVDLIEKADLKTLGKMALARKQQMHPTKHLFFFFFHFQSIQNPINKPW